MKSKILLFLSFITWMFCLRVYAGDGALFQFNDERISTEMTILNQLEEFVLSHPGATLNSLETDNFDLTTNLHLSQSDIEGILKSLSGGDVPLGIPAFWWGCVLGVVGIIIVYIVTKDSSKAVKAGWGCLASSATIGLWYFIYVSVKGGCCTR